MLEMRAVSSSNLKQATLFVEKYKQINGKLRSLNLDMMKMVNNITTFEQKLPCYLKSCI
jgi:aspartate ammonia-lyase